MSQIIIKHRPAPPPNLDGFGRLAARPDDFWAFRVATMLPDSHVEQVFFHRPSLRDMATWVAESLEKNPTPEVGGFLLGTWRNLPNDAFEVLVDTFFAAKNVDFASPNRLEFGHQTLHELDAVLQTMPDGTAVVGWFHTHPGHTPYLSGMDLTVHDGFFREKYQLAVVLDSLTGNWDTGIFTRKKSNQQVNNALDRSPKNWLPFKTIILDEKGD